MAVVVGRNKTSPEFVVADVTQPGVSAYAILPTAKDFLNRFVCKARYLAKEPGPIGIQDNAVRVQNQEVNPRPHHALTFVFALRKSI